MPWHDPDTLFVVSEMQYLKPIINSVLNITTLIISLVTQTKNNLICICFLSICEAMLKIQLEKIEEYQGKYIIFLDSENKYSFQNKRKAEDFLTLVSKRLTDTLVFINEDFTVAETIYRHYFFTIEKFKTRFQIEHSLDFIREKMSALLYRTGGENRNTLVFTGIENMLFKLKSVYANLNEVVISKSDAGMRHKIAVKLRILDLYMADFKHFEDEITVSRSEIMISHDVKLRRII
jgi:hypothetical protein